MPGFSTTKNVPQSTISAVKPIVGWVNASQWPFAEVLDITYSGDVMIPSKMTVCVHALDYYAETEVITLKNSMYAPQKINGLARVWARVGDETIFIGRLVKRTEVAGGDYINLEFWDERHFLNCLPVKGALVWDMGGNAVKFIPRFESHFNAGGYRNCTIATVNGIAGKNYVFTSLAEEATYGHDDDNVGNDEEGIVSGTAIAWTPARALQFLWLMTKFSAPAYNKAAWATLNSSWIDFPFPSFGSPGAMDTMNKKLQDMNCNGKTIANAMSMALEASGDWGFKVEYQKDKSVFGFYPLTAADALINPATDPGITLTFKRTGKAEDIRTVHEGKVETDYTKFRPSLHIESAPPIVESSFTTEEPAVTLLPDWNRTGVFNEEYNFMNIIVFAKGGNGEALKRSDGNPYVPATDKQKLIQLARTAYPKVFRAFKSSDPNNVFMLGILNGYANKYVDAPMLTNLRKLFGNDQLQPYFETTALKRGKLRIPVRVRVKRYGAADYADVLYNSGIRFEPDGLIYFDGLTDDINNGYSLYTGLFSTCISLDPTHATYPKLNNIMVNMAVYLDCRQSAISKVKDNDPNNVLNEIDKDITNGDGNGVNYMQHYILNNTGYREEHQVASYPIASSAMPSWDKEKKTVSYLKYYETTGLSRILKTDTTDLNNAALRRMKDHARVQRKQEWELIGIRLEFKAGQFVKQATIIDASETQNYLINAPINEVKYDFKNQRTSLLLK